MRPKHLLPALLIAAAIVGTGCGGDGDDGNGNGGATAPPAQTSEPGSTTAPAADGAEIFAANCSSCHRLAAANAGGVTGPDLDDLQPDFETTREQVTDGGGGMPAFEGDLSPAEIDAVSTYVADNAGR